MSVSFILKTTKILLTREWKKLLLPGISLFLTSLIVALTLSLTQSSQAFLQNQSKEINGGDVTIESSFQIPKEEVQSLFAAPYEKGEELRFNGTISAGSSTLGATIRAVDSAFPLYGAATLREGVYSYPAESEVYIDETVSKKLALSVGGSITFNGKQYAVKGVFKKEPDALFSGVRFLPRIIMSAQGLERSTIASSFLRADHFLRFKKEGMSAAEKEAFILYGKNKGVEVTIAGLSGGGFRQGLITVSQFLIVAVLVSSVLASVNIYASTVYLMSLLRRSFATLLALGLRKRSLALILFLVLSFVVTLAATLGSALSSVLFSFLQRYVKESLLIPLPTPSFVTIALVTLCISFATAFASFIPSLMESLRLSPRALLLGISDRKGAGSLWLVLVATGGALLPLIAVAAYLLGDVVKGIIIMLAILLLYGILSLFYIGSLFLLEKKSKSFPFSLRIILSQKKADGFFGIVSFSSLFVALIALATLSLTQVTLENYLSKDLQKTVPSLYSIDVQSSQQKLLTEVFPKLTLFPNVGARILSIDGKNIQEALARGDEKVDRELGREYNLTYRKELLSSEQIVKGGKTLGFPGEVSVDQDYAKRVGIALGSRIVFSVQGFEVSAQVTSLRKTESRSGLPFFYFILSPEDIAKFPTTYFGYAYMGEREQEALGRFVSTTMPNVTIIDTKEVSLLAASIIRLLLLFVFVIAVPPLVLALLLVATLVITSFKERKRDGARLLALGAEETFVTRLYFLETITTTLVASLLSYLIGILVTAYTALSYLKVSEYTAFSIELVFGFAALILLILFIGALLWKSDKRSLRSILLHEENH